MVKKSDTKVVVEAVGAAYKEGKELLSQCKAQQTKVLLINDSSVKMRVECTFHSETLAPNERRSVDWAYPDLPGCRPDVTIWWGGQKDTQKLVIAGQTSRFDGNNNMVSDAGENDT